MDGDDGGNVHEIYEHLRAEIVSGAMPPGAIVNQVNLAQALRVSRTPLREALRMLEAQHFVDAEHQHRMRVSDLDPEAVDALYASRILLESLGIALTVPVIRRAQIAELRLLLQRIDGVAAPTKSAPYAELEAPHDAFHRLLVSGAAPALRESIHEAMDHANRFRIAYSDVTPNTERKSRAGHHAIVAAIVDRDVEAAVSHLSSHLAQSAISLMASVAPHIEPRAVRAAVRIALGQAATAPNSAPRAVRSPRATPRSVAASLARRT
jgi:DNA-binding GntR family transcriptional regulator